MNIARPKKRSRRDDLPDQIGEADRSAGSPPEQQLYGAEASRTELLRQAQASFDNISLDQLSDSEASEQQLYGAEASLTELLRQAQASFDNISLDQLSDSESDNSGPSVRSRLPSISSNDFSDLDNTNGDDDGDNPMENPPLPKLIKMVRMFDCTREAPNINYSTSATVTSDIDSIVLRNRFFLNIGFLLWRENNLYTFSNKLHRTKPNNSSRIIVKPMVDEDTNQPKFKIYKNNLPTSSLYLHEFPNVKLGEINASHNLKLHIHFALLKADVKTNMFTKIQMGVIAACLNCAKFRYSKSNIFRCILPQGDVNLSNLEDFVVDDEKQDSITSRAELNLPPDEGLVLLSVFEELLGIMGSGKPKWDQYDIDFTKFCNFELLMPEDNMVNILISEARNLYNNRYWYLQQAGTKIHWPKRKPIHVELKDPKQLDKAAAELFAYDHRFLDTEVFNYGPFNNGRLQHIIEGELQVPQIAFDHALNVQPRDRGISFVTSSSEVVGVLSKVMTEYDEEEDHYRRSMFNTDEHESDFYPNGLLNQARNYITNRGNLNRPGVNMDNNGMEDGRYSPQIKLIFDVQI